MGLRLLWGNNFLMSRELVDDFDCGFAFAENLKTFDESRFLVVLYGDITHKKIRWFSHVMLQNCRQQRRNDAWSVFYSGGDYAPFNGAIVAKPGVVAICTKEQVEETINTLDGKRQQRNEDLYKKMQKMFGKKGLGKRFYEKMLEQQ